MNNDSTNNNPIQIEIHHNNVNCSDIHHFTSLGGREDDDDGARGLSTCHISRKTGEIILYPEGSLIEVSKCRPKIKTGRVVHRGNITGFSNKSRMRLFKKLGKVDKSQLPIFITLTYPATFPTEKEIYKRHLDSFIKRLIYRFPKIAGVWRLEYQKRGAPHYHLMVWGLSEGKVLQRYISFIWYKVVGSGDEKHLKAGTQVKRVRSWRGVMSYAAKYMAKPDDISEFNCGRVWGMFNRSWLPMSTVIIFEVSAKTVIVAMRLMRRYAHLKSRDYGALSILISDTKQWARALDIPI